MSATKCVNFIPSTLKAKNSKSGVDVTEGLNLNLIKGAVNCFNSLTSFNSTKVVSSEFLSTSNWLFGSNKVMFLFGSVTSISKYSPLTIEWAIAWAVIFKFKFSLNELIS